METAAPLSADPEILIVEDSPTQAERLKHVLEISGYRCAAARNGREALAAVAARPPTLVISDVMMPEMDGFELCRELKKDPRFRRIPIVLLTSLTDPIDMVRGLESGADNFIFKPCDEDHLPARIAQMLANRNLRESAGGGMEVFFAGQKFVIASDRAQILNLLLSTCEAAVKRNQELSAARDALRHLNDHLEAKVRERTAALEAEVAERTRAAEEVRRRNAELEQRVRERTARLEESNAELESFSYSVSHDLRAPLRHISGFIGLLEKRNAGKFDAESRGYFETVSRSAQKMSRLIDDLLDFSRMGRSEMRHSRVDLDALVRECIRDLEADTAGRQIAWSVEPLPAVQADPAMMRQVFANLLGNAVKYTRTREAAQIAVGVREEPGGRVFFVRDNGVGFDMQYVAQLFGVFQRLHDPAQFEGTGIGLANVRRIVARHGGRTWAEGKPGEGATFHFALPLASPGPAP